jgi:cysteine desulfurase
MIPYNELIYLDYNASTPVDKRVLNVMLPFVTDNYGNASSIHNFGSDAAKSIDNARIQVADLIKARSSEIIFTSGATESINLALKGFAFANRLKGNHIVTLETEHNATLETCKYLQKVGFDLDYLTVEKNGIVDLELLKSRLRHDTILVSVMFVNNEIGVIQPIKRIAEITHKLGIPLFSDASQAMGKIDIDVDNIGIDMLAFSGHKLYAPKGIGGLYIRKGIVVEPLIHGGKQERGIRSGTMNVPGIVALGKACAIAKNEMESDAKRISTLRNLLEREMLRIPNSFVNGSIKKRIHNVSNICFPGEDANVLIGKLKNVAISNGSACTSAVLEPSHVLKALGLSDENAFASLRFSLGKYSTENEIQSFVKIFQKVINHNTDAC